MHPSLIENVIIFNHVPKARGTSLTDLFRAIYGPEKCFRHRARDPKEDKYSVSIGALSEKQLHQYLFVSGCFDFGNHTRFSRPAKYITVVRDPIDRVVSDDHYNKARGRKDRQALTAQVKLDEYIQLKLDNAKSRLVRSTQVQYVSEQNDVGQAVGIIRKEWRGVTFVPYDLGEEQEGQPQQFCDLDPDLKARASLVNMSLLARAPVLLRTSSFMSSFSKLINSALRTISINRTTKFKASPLPEAEILQN